MLRSTMRTPWVRSTISAAVPCGTARITASADEAFVGVGELQVRVEAGKLRQFVLDATGRAAFDSWPR